MRPVLPPLKTKGGDFSRRADFKEGILQKGQLSRRAIFSTPFQASLFVKKLLHFRFFNCLYFPSYIVINDCI